MSNSAIGLVRNSVIDDVENASSGKGAGVTVAVCLSTGGIPNRLVDEAEVVADGLVGDGHAHEKHNKPHRAVLLQDIELLAQLEAEGLPVAPGVLGENLTVRGLQVQQLAVGTRFRLENGPLLELSEPRKPCFVLDEIHPDLQEAVHGRGGVFARVLEPGRVFVGQGIVIEPGETDGSTHV